MSKIDAILSIPENLRPARLVPLPEVAIRLIADYYRHEQFVRACGDGMAVADAGRLVLGAKSPQTAYTLLHRIEEAGSPTSLFQRSAIDLFRAERIPWGHLIEGKGWATPFFVRLAGGPAALGSLREACPNLAHAKATIRQSYDRGDLATVQVLLFACHTNILETSQCPPGDSLTSH